MFRIIATLFMLITMANAQCPQGSFFILNGMDPSIIQAAFENEDNDVFCFPNDQNYITQPIFITRSVTIIGIPGQGFKPVVNLCDAVGECLSETAFQILSSDSLDPIHVTFEYLAFRNTENNPSTTTGGRINFESFSRTDTLEIKNCEFDSIYAENGGSIYVKGLAQVVISDTLFEEHFANIGGAVQLENVELAVFEEVTFRYNHASIGGALAVSNIHHLEIIGSTFFANSVHSSDEVFGGAIYIEGATTVTVDESTFRSNEAAGVDGGFGGAIFVQDNANITLSNTQFIDNLAVTNGAAIYAKDSASITFTGDADSHSQINNLATQALAHRSSICLTSSSSFSASELTFQAAFPLVVDSADVYVGMTNCLFKDADTSDYVYSISPISFSFVDPNLKTWNGEFIGCRFENMKAKNGGVFSLTGPVRMRIVDAHFSDTAADNYGGAIWASRLVELSISRSMFQFSSAEIAGGAIALQNGPLLSISETTFKQCTSQTGGAIYLLELTSVSETVSTQLAIFDSEFIKNSALLARGADIFVGESIRVDPEDEIHEYRHTIVLQNVTSYDAYEPTGIVDNPFCFVISLGNVFSAENVTVVVRQSEGGVSGALSSLGNVAVNDTTRMFLSEFDYEYVPDGTRRRNPIPSPYELAGPLYIIRDRVSPALTPYIAENVVEIPLASISTTGSSSSCSSCQLYFPRRLCHLRNCPTTDPSTTAISSTSMLPSASNESTAEDEKFPLLIAAAAGGGGALLLALLLLFVLVRRRNTSANSDNHKSKGKDAIPLNDMGRNSNRYADESQNHMYASADGSGSKDSTYSELEESKKEAGDVRYAPISVGNSSDLYADVEFANSGSGNTAPLRASSSSETQYQQIAKSPNNTPIQTSANSVEYQKIVHV